MKNGRTEAERPGHRIDCDDAAGTPMEPPLDQQASPKSTEKLSILSAQSWEQTVKAELPKLLRMAVRFCGDPFLAEDCVQQAVLKATAKRNRFDGKSKLGTWLHQIVINECRDQWRKKQRNRETEVLEDSAANKRSTLPESEVSQKEQEARLRSLIQDLPERQREVLILSVWDERSAAEISEFLKIDISAVYSNLSAARKKLRTWLGSD